MSFSRQRLLVAAVAAGLAAVFALPTVAPAPAAAAPQVSAGCPAALYGANSSAPATGSAKTVALTFDDGPGASTASLLSILASYGVPATFFNIGQNMAARPALVRQEAQAGYVLGNHTWDHPNMTTLSASAQAAEMDQASAEQASLTGTQPCSFRPPGGSYNSTTLSLAQQRAMKVWTWSVDTEDWKANGSSSSYWVNRIISLAESEGRVLQHPVVLMHNQPAGNPATVLALPTIINYFRDNGYTFVDLYGRTRLLGGVLGDITGDGKADILATDSSGNLWMYPNTGTGAFGARALVGSGWAGYRVAAVADLYGSGRAGILAIDPSGRLLYYPNTGGTGSSTFGARSQVGTGWTGGYRIAGLTDLYRTGRPGILAVAPGGRLLYYPSTGGSSTSTFGASSEVGVGWIGYTIDPADINGDGRPDMLAVNSAGNLYQYPNVGGTGSSTFGARTQVGSGWSSWQAIDAGSLTGGSGADILAIDSSGNLYLYPHAGGTGFGARTLVGSGWTGFIIN